MAKGAGRARTKGAPTPKGPGLFNAGVVGVVMSLVAALALTARQEPPPTVAEFAPQAVEQIKESLPEQAEAPDTVQGTAGETGDPEQQAAARASERAREQAEEAEDPPGNDDPEDTPSEGGGKNPDAEPTPEPEEPDRARVRPCVATTGTPPRQTEDPQSPPCVPYFDGDNGGETSFGVTRDEIRIAVPLQEFGGALPEDVQDFVDHFNRRYEFHGRKMVIKTFRPEGGTFAHPDPALMQKDAQTVYDLQAFASIAYPDRKGSEHHYYDALADKGIISSAFRGQSRATEQRYSDFHPYEWNVMSPIETMLSSMGEMICNTLAGDPPQGGGIRGDGQQNTDPLGEEQGDRVFGLIYGRAKDGSIPPVEILEGELAACGADLAATRPDSGETPNGDSAILAMTDKDVTTVIYLGDPGPLRTNYMASASNQRYFPEWVVSSYIDMDVDNVFQPGTAPPEQSRNVMGLSFRNKLLPRQNMPWYWALRESSPDKDRTGGNYYPLMATYQQLLQLASGIQMAGPNLTPETFAEGLQSTEFPNPNAGQAPYYQAAVSYAGRHTAFDDAALYFYDPQASGTVDPGVPGAVCYIDAGTRVGLGSYPKAPQPFFSQCR